MRSNADLAADLLVRRRFLKAGIYLLLVYVTAIPALLLGALFTHGGGIPFIWFLINIPASILAWPLFVGELRGWRVPILLGLPGVNVGLYLGLTEIFLRRRARMRR